MSDERRGTPSELAEGGAVPGAKTARWEQRLQKFCVTIGRIGLAYLFFSQLGWKLPPTFGCPADFRFTTGTTEKLTRSNGLCDWIGIEAVWANQPRSLLISNIDGRGKPEIAIPIGWAAQLNGAFITNVVQPNIRWFGWLIWGAEAFIFVTMFLGLFTRLGALVAIGLSLQLTIGLAGISLAVRVGMELPADGAALDHHVWPGARTLLRPGRVTASPPGRDGRARERHQPRASSADLRLRDASMVVQRCILCREPVDACLNHKR